MESGRVDTRLALSHGVVVSWFYVGRLGKLLVVTFLELLLLMPLRRQCFVSDDSVFRSLKVCAKVLQ